MIIAPGDKAPIFTLRNTKTEEISLENYKEKNVVILFFPLAFTGVCTKELCMMRDSLSKYSDLNAEIIAISVDSPFVLAKFKEANQLDFTLLSDFNKEVSRSYGVLYEEFVLNLKGVSKRSAFVVDKNGTIRYAEVLENAGELPNFVALEKTLEDIN